MFRRWGILADSSSERNGEPSIHRASAIASAIVRDGEEGDVREGGVLIMRGILTNLLRAGILRGSGGGRFRVCD
jgi:hypothetical protein